jgi:DoxX-like family
METSIAFSKTRRIFGNSLLTLSSLMLLGSAGAKFAHVPKVVEQLNGSGFEGKIMLIAAGEALSALLFLLPVTRSLGLLLVSGLMGGAIATHMQHGVSYSQPAFFLLFVWVSAVTRHPEILWSFRSSNDHLPVLRRHANIGVGR